MRDGHGITQLWTISPNGGVARQVTANDFDISSAFTWSPDGAWIAHTMDQSVCHTHVQTGHTIRLTQPNSATPLRPEACVYSPNGKQIAYVREVTTDGQTWNQIFTTTVAATQP